MKAVVVTKAGSEPEVAERQAPTPTSGEILVEMEAAALNPVDVAIASGEFYAGHPPHPYVPGLEAVGRAQDGSRVFVLGGGLGVSRDGTCAEVFSAPTSAAVALRDDIDAATAAALGTAALAGWLPMVESARVAEAETVIVLGATGTAGRIAVQAARLHGAARVVAAGRDPDRLRELATLADTVVPLGAPDLAARFQSAAPDGADVVFDPLWGDPLVAALSATRPGARVVHVGQSAGPIASLPSSLVRGRRLTILGYSNFGIARDVLEAAYLAMVDLAAAGRLSLPVQRRSIDEIGEAWAGVKMGSGKFVVTAG